MSEGNPLARLIDRFAASAKRRYFVGPQLSDALAAHHALGSRGFQSTLGYWNRAGEPGETTLAVYRAGVDALAADPGRSYLSIKPWVFDYDEGTYRQLLVDASRKRVFLHLDSLEWAGADPAMRLLASGEHHPGGIGLTIPARWRRSRQDAEWATERGVTVRVVKGQHAEPGLKTEEIVPRFEEIVATLAYGKALVRIATHDAPLAQRALECLAAAGCPAELELLYGLPVRQPLAAARALQVPVRIYIPFGYGYLPYSLGALRRRPRVAWWLVKDALNPKAVDIRY